jgi:hypothetical protein
MGSAIVEEASNLPRDGVSGTVSGFSRGIRNALGGILGGTGTHCRFLRIGNTVMMERKEAVRP